VIQSITKELNLHAHSYISIINRKIGKRKKINISVEGQKTGPELSASRNYTQ
jgi:hypothetical protein